MTDDNFVFKAEERVEFEGFAHPFKGKVLGSLNGTGQNLYYVQSNEGEVRIFAGKVLVRL